MKKYLFLLVLVVSCFIVRAQNNFWKEANQPYGSGEWGGQLTLVNGNNGTLYSYVLDGAQTRVYASTDTGSTWIALEYIATMNSVNPGRLHIGHAGNFYAPDSTAGWRRSTNEGISWELLPGTSDFGRLVETSTGTLIGWKWNATENQFYRSTDLGQSWTLQASFPAVDMVLGYPDFEVSPFGGVFGKVTQNSLNYLAHYNSTDDGQSWVRLMVGEEFNLLFASTSGAIFFKKSLDARLYRMAGPGQPLVVINSAINFNSLTMLASGRILASTISKALFYSDNDGLNWQELDTDSEVSYLQKMDETSDGSLFCFVRNALAKSKDGGSTWEFCGYGIRRGKLIRLRPFSDSIYVASTSFGLWRSEDAGLHWDLLVATKEVDLIRDFELTSTGGILYISNQKLYYSASIGAPFENITPSQASLNFDPRIFVNPANQHLYLKTLAGLYHSNDTGQSWTLLSALPAIRHVSFHPSGRIIVNSDSEIYYSDNNAQTWVEINDAVFNMMTLKQTWVSPTGGVLVGLDDIAGNQETLIAYSEDLGETWQVTGQFLSSVLLSNVVVTLNDHIYITNTNYTYLSVNRGLTWQTLVCPERPTALECETGILLTSTPSHHLFLQIQPLNCYITSSPVTQGAYIEGQVRLDADADCSTPDAQAPLKNRIVKAEGGPFNFYTNTDVEGHYIFYLDTGAYEVVLQNPNIVWWNYCDNNIPVILQEPYTIDTVDFAVIPLAYCPLITVNVGIPLLRRCFNSEVYVAYCNEGTEPADSAWVDITLDPYLSLVSSGQAYQVLGGNTIRFFIGDMPSGECGEFQLTVYVDCDSTVLGQTHCITAHGFPDTLCTIVPNWSGANIEASVSCQDSLIHLKLENTGTAPSQLLEYIIIEDDVVLFSGEKYYTPGESLILNYPANGSTWRIESNQEPGHPFSNLALAFTEGCGGFNSLGFINQFPVNGIQPTWHRMCIENIGSYDPNDKQGFPSGIGTDHDIRPGQSIDYMIRFQNTGTDTAFRVLIRDTLSAFLDPGSFRAGASSHPYTWELNGQGVVTFTFNNILLPDSNVNFAGSQGFVQFNIGQIPMVPRGSVIENSAAIYFDFNEPVITNTTWHTIAKKPAVNALQPEPGTNSLDLGVWPNPFYEQTNLHVGPKTAGTLWLKVYNSSGLMVSEKSVTGPNIEFNAKQLPTGLYWAEIRDTQGRLLGQGKLAKQ